MKNDIVQPALLTRTEIEWLQGKLRISNGYQRRIKSEIRKKLRILATLEFPLLVKAGIFSDELTVCGKNLTIYSKAENSINHSNSEIQYQNMVGRKGCVTISVLKEDFLNIVICI